MIKTKLRHKILLVLAGVLASLILLEIGLRIGGFIFLSFQEHLNRASLKEGNEYRILCIGESTTALGGKDSYPRQLERILNARQDKIKFSVINKGIPSVSTDHIATSLKDHLSRYNPNMVVSMIGINDKYNRLHKSSRLKLFLENFRVYKLKKLLDLHVSRKIKEFKDKRLTASLEKRKQQLAQNPKSIKYTKLAAVCLAANRNDEAMEILDIALKLNPRNYGAMIYVGLLQKRTGDYQKAAQTFEEILALPIRGNDVLVWSYAELAECYKMLENYKKAEEIYRKAMKSFPNKTGAFGCLAELYIEQERYAEARKLLEKQLKINPQATLFYGKLAHCYRKEGQFHKAERLLWKALQINPKDVELYFEIGAFLLENNRYREAEKVFTRALSLPHITPDALITLYQQLITTDEALGKLSQAKKMRTELALIQSASEQRTFFNYHKIKQLLDAQGIPLVATQYPMRDVAPLKRMLGDSATVTFVDNQKRFEAAVEQGGYDAYFTDRFGGNFGHCTSKGNYLLASNVADAILSQVLPNLPSSK